MEDIKEIRKTILEIVNKANVSHIGSALSVVDILYSLYFKVANISFKNINDKNRDIIILSKGHSSAALYSVLYHRGFLGKDEIDEKIQKVLNYDGPVICDVKVPEWQLIIPRVSSKKLPDGSLISSEFEDMFPFLPEEEMKENMSNY